MTVFYVACLLGLLAMLAGLLVLLRAGNKAENRVFFVVCLLSAAWSMCFASIELPSDIGSVSFLNKLSFFLGLLLLLSATAFTYFFPKRQPLRSFWLYSVVTAPVAVLCFTEFVAGTVVYSQAGGSLFAFQFGPLTLVYVAVFVLGIILIAANSIVIRKQVDPQARAQLNFIAAGYSLSLLIGIGLSTIWPIISPGTSVDNLAPASLTAMILLVSYAIIKHRLFDFRAVVARSFAYLVSLSLFAVTYVILIVIMNRLVFYDSRLSRTQLLVNAGATLFLVSIYSRTKGLFDKITDKLFYRDKYDSQELLDDLNQTLVSHLELEDLLHHSAKIIQGNLKSSSCGFYIRETAYFSGRLVGVFDEKLTQKVAEEIQEKAVGLSTKVHSAEVQTDSNEEHELNVLMRKNDVEVMARLVNTLDYAVRGIGCLFLGPKKSGTQYTAQDIRILEIIANEMVIAVENALRFEEIQQFNVTLQRKIDDATRELKKTNDKLLALDEAKDEFVSMASHQLRTPLTSIKGYISMVLDGDAGKINDQQKQMLGQALFSSQRMVYLISDLLNVSRLKTGKFVIEAKPVYLPDLIESELSQLYEGASAKNITLSFEKPKEFTTLNLDDMKIRQVVMNFTDNAIYYTPSGGKITVSLKDKKDSVEFRVKDTGIGVSKHEQHRLFTKFYRAENARKARPDGTGLGLFMAKKVIVAQGGSLIFESKEGKGSTFGFSFPKERLAVATHPASEKA